MDLIKKIEYSINLLRKCENMALEMDPENGFYLAFSGGKDSQVLYHIAKMAGVKFKSHMNLTSVDPPEVIRFVKQHYPDVVLIDNKSWEMIESYTLDGALYDLGIESPLDLFIYC